MSADRSGAENSEEGQDHNPCPIQHRKHCRQLSGTGRPLGIYRILPRKLQYGGPVDGDDLRRWKGLCNFDPENAWTCSDVQNLFGGPRPAADFAGQYFGAHPRKGAHAARKLHPDGVVRRNVRKPSRTAVSHDRSRIAQKIIQYFGCGDELDGRAHIGWRIAIEEHFGRGRHSVLSALLGQETMDHKVIAQDAYPTLRGACHRRQQCCRFALADMSKEIELDGRPDRCRLSACKQRIDHEFGRHYASMGVLYRLFAWDPPEPSVDLAWHASRRNYAYIHIFYNTYRANLIGCHALMGELSSGRAPFMPTNMAALSCLHQFPHGCRTIRFFPHISIAVSTRPSRMHARDDVAEPESRFDATSRCGASKVRPTACIELPQDAHVRAAAPGCSSPSGDNSFV